MPPDVLLAMYKTMHAGIGISRPVVVKGSAQGTDKRAMPYALEHLPDRSRGVAAVAPEIYDNQLRRMAVLGVRKLRYTHMFVDG